MASDHAEEARATAVEQLTELGLSTYAARTFVALATIGEGTAQDVSDVADVPRTRVYDAAEELMERGLVDAKQSNPKRFWAISTESTGRHFEQAYAHHVSMLTDALDSLRTTTTTTEQQGVWTVTGRDTVTERVVEFISRADDEVVFMTIEDVLTDAVVDALESATDRGVTIRLTNMSGTTETRLEETIPDAEVFESLWAWDDTPAGRLLMVDQQRTLVSVLVPGNGDNPPERRDETAIWGSGETNSLVVVLKALFTWELDENRT